MLESIHRIVGVLAGITAVIAFGVGIYPKARQGDLVLSIDKDVVTAPPQLVRLGAWAVNNREPFRHACQSPISVKPKDVLDAVCQIPDLHEYELYSRSDFGSITIGIANGRSENVRAGTALRISKLKSFQGVTANSNFIADLSKHLEDWNKQQLIDSPTPSDPDNKYLLLPLPELKTAGYLRLTVYGRDSGSADAEIVGLENAPAQRVYLVKSSAAPTGRVPWWVAVLSFLLFIVSVMLLLARPSGQPLRAKSYPRIADPSHLTKTEVQAMAEYYDLFRNWSVNPHLRLKAGDVSYWYEQNLPEKALQMEFESRRIVLEQAERSRRRIPTQGDLSALAQEVQTTLIK